MSRAARSVAKSPSMARPTVAAAATSTVTTEPATPKRMGGAPPLRGCSRVASVWNTRPPGFKKSGSAASSGWNDGLPFLKFLFMTTGRLPYYILVLK
jgi:hypothetical protein